jgi:hypothetical protein
VHPHTGMSDRWLMFVVPAALMLAFAVLWLLDNRP